MHFKFLIIPTILVCQVAGAQNGPASTAQPQTNSQAAATTPVSAASSTPVVQTDPTPAPATPASPVSDQVAIMDYKSVYETATVEEEVKMAAERFSLTPAQQDMWLTAATDRRLTEKQAREKIDSKAPNYEKDGAYRGLRASHNTFHDIIMGYLTPAQKQSFEMDRLILQEKQKRLAKLPPPPPPPPAPTVTVAPVDSAALKEPEKGKGSGKKSKKKKKPVG